MRRAACTSLLVLLSGVAAHAGEITVGGGGAYATISEGIAAASPGDSVVVAAGTYNESVTVSASGASGAPIIVRAADGATVTVDPSTDAHGFYLSGVAYIHIVGFRITNSATVTDKSGVRLYGAVSDVEIRDNEIYGITGSDAMGITVYGTDGAGIVRLVIDGNTVRDCEPAQSEALTINGNVADFEVTGNTVRDVNNIGIDVIGGEAWLSTAFPDNGLIAGNTVTRANSNYGGGYAGGIYCDGASNITIERNTVTECDFGIEVGAENASATTIGVVVRSNFVSNNYKGGIVFGGYDVGVGRVQNCVFLNNTLYKNCRPGETTPQGSPGAANAEVIIQWASDCTLQNNILLATDTAEVLDDSWGTNSGMVWSHNVYWRTVGGFSTPGGAGSLTADPQLAGPASGDLHLQAASPAREAGSAHAQLGTLDIDGEARSDGTVDVGADEVHGPGGSLSVSLAEPADGAARIAPATVTIVVIPVATACTVTKVAFYVDLALLDEDTDSASGWTAQANALGVGSYDIYAVAYGDGGETGTSTTVTVTLGADADADGLPDDWETAHGLDPGAPDQDGNGTNDGLDDWDGDGTDNGAELAQGTSPGTAPWLANDGGGCTPGEAAAAPALYVLLLWIARRGTLRHPSSRAG